MTRAGGAVIFFMTIQARQLHLRFCCYFLKILTRPMPTKSKSGNNVWNLPDHLLFRLSKAAGYGGYATVLTVFLLTATVAPALEYSYVTIEPQKSGWPLTREEREYVLKPEHERRPGTEQARYLPALWPVIPSAGYWGGTSWLNAHAKLVETVQASPGNLDILLIGDSITLQWGDAWSKNFGGYKTINLGLGGDKTQNVLWRLDHGGVVGLSPRLVILQVGNNNIFFTSETGIPAAANGIKMCVANLREKFPKAELILVKIFPAQSPGSPFYEDIKKVNAALDQLKLDADPKVHVLDFCREMVNADGTLKKELFASDQIHLTQHAGYELYALKLKPLVEKLLGPGRLAVSGDDLPEQQKHTTALKYHYRPYGEGKLDPQPSGWPLTEAETKFISQPEYERKPGREVSRNLPEMWPVTPTAGYWVQDDAGGTWLAGHAKLVKSAHETPPEILLMGDNLIQHWGGSALDGKPFIAPWQNNFGHHRAVNLGLDGDKTEQVLWRLEHGAIDGLTPKVVVLLVGENYAPIITPCGVPVNSVAQGIKLCVEIIRAKCPGAQVVVVKLLPAWDPDSAPRQDIKRVNAALDELKLDRDPQLHILDLWSDLTTPDGSLKESAYYGPLLNESGYGIFADKLRPLLERLLAD
jgi:platelet-activating factor acetylhydrolase IB subunit beta/gamma